MTEEFEIFQKSKATELKQGMMAYADSHIDFYTKVWVTDIHLGISISDWMVLQGAALWESILPVLESIQLDDDKNNNSTLEDDDA